MLESAAHLFTTPWFGDEYLNVYSGMAVSFLIIWVMNALERWFKARTKAGTDALSKPKKRHTIFGFLIFLALNLLLIITGRALGLKAFTTLWIIIALWAALILYASGWPRLLWMAAVMLSHLMREAYQVGGWRHVLFAAFFALPAAFVQAAREMWQERQSQQRKPPKQHGSDAMTKSKEPPGEVPKSSVSRRKKPKGGATESSGTPRKRHTAESLTALGIEVLKPSGRTYSMPTGPVSSRPPDSEDRSD